MTLGINIAMCLVFAGLRLGGMTHDFFKDIVHVYVGGLLVAGWFRNKTLHVYHDERQIYAVESEKSVWHRNPWFWRAAWLLTAVEVFAFIGFKYGWLTKVIGQ